MTLINQIHKVSKDLLSNRFFTEPEIVIFKQNTSELCNEFRKDDCPFSCIPKLHYLEVHVINFVELYKHTNLFGEGRIEQSHQNLFHTLIQNKHFGRDQGKQLTNSHYNIFFKLWPPCLAFKENVVDYKPRNLKNNSTGYNTRLTTSSHTPTDVDHDHLVEISAEDEDVEQDDEEAEINEGDEDLVINEAEINEEAADETK